jgi:hypothetical protein
MQLSHALQATSVTFDEPNLIASAGLVPAVALAERVEIRALADEHVRLSGEGRANAGWKVMSVVAGMLAGADSIDDLDLLRHGGTDKVFSGLRAPSTLGTFLRGFTFGHVRQLDAVASRTLLRLAREVPGLIDPTAPRVYVDIDDTIGQVYGTRKQGAEFGYSKVRGLNAQLAAVSTATSAPVIAATRMRRGAAASAHGAPKMLTDTLAAVRRTGHTAPVLVRADSAYYQANVVAAITAGGARYSITVKQNSAIRRAIGEIDADDWVRIQYTQAIADPHTGELISAAEVAEVPYTAFAAKKRPASARLIVRRVPELNPKKLQGQTELFPVYRYHAVFTNNTDPLVQAEAEHRRHAIIEQIFEDLKASALAHMPSGKFNANAAWLVCAAIAHNLARAIGVTAGGRFTKAATPTIRNRLINTPARIARSGRQLNLRLPENWKWAPEWHRMWTTITSPRTG